MCRAHRTWHDNHRALRVASDVSDPNTAQRSGLDSAGRHSRLPPNSLGLPSGRLFGTVTAERISDGLQTLALGVNAHEQSDETTGKHDAGTDEVTADKGGRARNRHR